MREDVLSQLRHDIISRYEQKYGDVFVHIDELHPEGEYTAKFQATISDNHGFITRHYGKAEYKGDQLSLHTAGI